MKHIIHTIRHAARAAMTLVFAAVGMSAWADEVTAEQALEQAQQFVSSHNKRKSAPTVKSAGQVSGLYMFNVSSGGFVIVSNDDQTVPILGFGESGSVGGNAGFSSKVSAGSGTARSRSVNVWGEEEEEDGMY